MNQNHWRHAGCAVLGLALFAAGAAAAQHYPDKPVRIIVPGSPGGGNDFMARIAGQKLGERLGQQFLVEYRPGAGGTIGAAYAANAAPDGYTLLLGFIGQMAMAPHAAKTNYDPLRDFVGLSLLSSSFLVFASHPSLPVRSVKQLIAFAKARPGELNYAAGNIWTPTHLAPELFLSVTGIKAVPIFYKGTGPAAIATIAGEAHMLFSSFVAVMPHVRSKRLVALGVNGAKRSPIAPDVPTLAESGVSGVDAPTWYSLVAPSATPKDIVTRLNGELTAIIASSDYREKLARQGMDPRTTTLEEFAAFLRAEYDRWGKVVHLIKRP